MWGISFEMCILDIYIEPKKWIFCTFRFSGAGDQTHASLMADKCPTYEAHFQLLESSWADFKKGGGGVVVGDMRSSGF